MAVTLKDIAQAAGVSLGTVERALKRKGRINPENAERIRRIAEEMNYRPNRIASGLVGRGRNRYRIAVILHVAGGRFWDEVFQGIRSAEETIKDYGFTIVYYYGADFDPERQVALINQAVSEEADAIIIVPVNAEPVRERLKKLIDTGFPVVYLNSFLPSLEAFASIHCDYYRSGRIAAMLVDRLTAGKGRTLIFLPSDATFGNSRRHQGILDYYGSGASGIRVLHSTELSIGSTGTEDASSPDRNEQKIRETLLGFPDADSIIFCGDSGTALRVLQDTGRRYTSVFFDLSESTRAALLDDRIQAVVDQPQADQGFLAVDVLFRHFISGTEPVRETLLKNNILFKECID